MSGGQRIAYDGRLMGGLARAAGDGGCGFGGISGGFGCGKSGSVGGSVGGRDSGGGNGKKNVADSAGLKLRALICYLLPLTCYLLMVGCNNSVSQSYQGQYVFPAGTGAFSLFIDNNGQDARTIMPDAMPDFAMYDLAFTGTADVTVSRNSANLSDPVYLATGSYNLLVTAYLDAGKTEPAAWGGEDGIVIDAGVGISHTVGLKVFTPDGTGYGTFAWGIDFPAGVSEATMKVTPMAANGTAEAVYFFDGAGGNAGKIGSLSLKSGYYNVLFTFKKTGVKTVEWLEILHVYQNMASTYSQVFTDDYFNNINYTVTFVFNDAITTDGQQNRAHGDLVSAVTDPARGGYTFGGWYSADGNYAPENEWDFAARRLSGSLSLYARWYANIGSADFSLSGNDAVYNSASQNVTVVYADPAMDSDTAGEITVYYAGAGATVYAQSETAPVNAGEYGVSVTTAGGSAYAAIAAPVSVGTLTVEPKPLAIDGVSAVNRDYDGTTVVALSGGTLDGVEDGDDVAFTLNDGTIADANAEGGKAVVTGIALNGADADNYALAQPDGVTVDISKAAPVVTFPTSASLTYEQTLAQASLAGQGNTTAGAFAFSSPATAPSVAQSGNFSMVFTPSDTANYNTVTQNVYVTVNKAVPSYTVPAGLTAVYGDALSAVALPSGWSWNAAANAVGNAGARSHPATFTPADTANYNTAAQSINIAVAQKALAITGAAHTKAYNGTNAAAGVTVTLSGTVGGDIVSANTVTAAYTGVNAGTTTINITAVTLTGAAAGNYTVTVPANNVTVAGITKAVAPTLTLPVASAVTYGALLSGSSNLSGGSTGGAWAWTASGTRPVVGNSGYSVTFTPTDTLNYDWSGVTLARTVSITVNRKALTITGVTAAARVYDGTTTVTLAGGTLAGIESGDTVTFTLGSGTVANANAGNGKAVTTSITLGGANAGNYTLTQPTVTVNINKATPTVTTWPAVSGATFGQTLSQVGFTGGAASTSGAFAWATPTTSVGSGGARSFSMTFTPADTTNYNTVTQSISITVTYLVSFNTNGGGSISNQNISSGSAARPANPSRSGYTFDYWYTNETLTMPYNFSANVTNNITLYAKWVSNADITAMAGKNMVWVSGGSFQMGKCGDGSGSPYANVTPVHTVILSGYWMSKHQVTQKQYCDLMGTTIAAQQTLASGGSTNYGRGDNYPMYYVSWYDAVVFCNKLSTAEGLSPAYMINGSVNPTDWGSVPASSDAVWNEATVVTGANGYRLPTEAQWEFAAKGGTKSAGYTGAATDAYFVFSGSNDANEVAWYSGKTGTPTGNTAHEVGLLAANELGICDMSGNVWEWCWDWNATYTSVAQTDPVGASSGSSRVLRGGSWYSSAEILRSAVRVVNNPSSRSNGFGFRLVRP